MRRPTSPLMLAGVFAVVCAARSGGDLLSRAPTEYRARVNPFASSQTAISAGHKLFLRECAQCHGRNGEGLGKAPPLSLPSTAGAPPGAIFWVLRNGSLWRGMRSFAHLPEPQRWQIVTYIKTLSSLP